MDVTLREFAGDKRKKAVIWSNPLFPIEITRPRVPRIASKFLKLTLTCISTNSRKPILRFWLGWFGNSPPRLFRGLSVQIWRAESQISHIRWHWWDVDVPYLSGDIFGFHCGKRDNLLAFWKWHDDPPPCSHLHLHSPINPSCHCCMPTRVPLCPSSIKKCVLWPPNGQFQAWRKNTKQFE
jgi:hypothetical protein